MSNKIRSLEPLTLPEGITEKYIDCTQTNGINFHILEAGHDASQPRPLVLLVHGFPEMAFSWRKIMPGLAAAGNHVVAVDQRGYGRTTGWDDRPYDEADLGQFTFIQLTTDMVTLVSALGYTKVKSIVGHDFGGVTVSMCALMRPDLFNSVVMMSHPFKGSPRLPFDIESPGAKSPQRRAPIEQVEHDPDFEISLADLDSPRKHYKWYNSTKSAADDWLHPAQGLHDFLRGYVHIKSANWKHNAPHPLTSWTAPQLAQMPFYYVMPLKASMGEVVADYMQLENANATKHWLSDADLDVYVQEWKRTGFQGGLNWYRSATSKTNNAAMALFAGKKIECPSLFLSGKQDWGNYQEPGALDSYPYTCSDFRGTVFVDGAGHWPQQEQPEKIIEELLKFLKGL